jgi:NAD(P)-dependent dehydrogenase (short-subunit alcohol dehydrogenase family)/putative sterol carrier protein
MAAKNEIRFDDHVAIITGAGAGLGRTYALELGKRGAKVVVNDFGGARDGSGAGAAGPADLVVEEIRKLGGQAVANYDNVATPEGGANIVKTAVDTFGKVDILINNAGILRDKGILKMEPENWDAVLKVHLYGAYNVTKPAFAVMKENGYGRIIITTSAAGLYGNFGQTNYSAAKLGLVGFMNTLKLEGAKYGIKVNTVAPLAASRLTEDVLPPDMLAKMKPEYVAPIVLYLCSKECQDTGRIYNAGAGYYNRAAIMTSTGVVVGGGKKVPSVEDVSASWSKIMDLKGAMEYSQANDLIMGEMMTVLGDNPPAAKDGGGQDAKVIFEKMPSVFDAAAAAGKDVTFQFNLSGAGGGDWAVIVKDGKCNVSAGKVDNPTTTIVMDGSDFVDLITGKLDGMKAFSAGKLKVKGDTMKSQLLGKLFKF